MTFKNCIENFPINDTLIGYYHADQSFSVPFNGDVNDIEKWDDNPFWEDSSCYSFIVFLPLVKKFECWQFLYNRVKGYLNETYDTDEFYPVTYSEDFGWTKIDPFDPAFEEQVTSPDDELAMELGWPLDKLTEDKWRREQVAYLFDHEAYMNGFIFTSPEAVKKFVDERKDLL